MSRRIPARVQQFLAKKVTPKDFIKEYTYDEIMEEVESILPNYNWGDYRPRGQHQAATILTMLCDPTMWCCLAMGGGKTFCAIHTIAMRMQLKEIKKPTLVICPTFVVNTWAHEVPKFTNLGVNVLTGSSTKKWEQLRQNTDTFVCINYQGFLALVSKSTPTKVRNKMVNKRVPSSLLIREIAAMFDAVILDESQAVKTIDSGITKAVNELTSRVGVRYGLTGTPFHDPQDLWSQSYVIDKGVTFGDNISLFRAAFFDKSQSYWGGWDYALRQDMEAHLHRRFSSLAIRYEESEFDDLPPLIEQEILLPLLPKAKAAYKELLKKAREEVEHREIENVYVRLRQVCSGFIDSKAKDNPLHIVYEDSSKLLWLLDFMKGIDAHQKVVIFTEFIETGKQIMESFKKGKIKAVQARGTKGRMALDDFQNNASVQALVVNSKSGGAGLNLQCAFAAIFYELPASVIVYNQAMKRVHRLGQEKTVHHYYLLTQDTIEPDIKESLDNGTTVLDKIMDGRYLL